MKKLTDYKIPFNKPHLTGKELSYIKEAHDSGMLSGDGPFTKRCHQWFEDKLGVKKSLLTHSCTVAMEMQAILVDIGPSDEVIIPSFSFVSAANAFILRGAVPMFVDIRGDTLNIDEKLIKAAITFKAKAIMPVHYSGVGCEMDKIVKIALEYNLVVLEDNAQGLFARYKDKYLGTILVI